MQVWKVKKINMLKIDEKKIRKGKAVGLPYVGSKKKISKKIVEIIKQNFGTDKIVYDVFGGGGAITAELMINGIDVVYNDLDKTITDMFSRVLSQDREWIKTLIVSREEFFRILAKYNKTVDDEIKLLVNSFGNNRSSYLYSKEMSDIKLSLMLEIIKKHDVIAGYTKTDTYIKKVLGRKDFFKQATDERNGRKIIHPLQHAQSLDQLERVQELKKIGISPTTTNKDYHYFSDVEDSILYLDPPYENAETSQYKEGIDYKEFYDWTYEMSKNNIVLLSSYELSDPRFEVVYEFKTARSTFVGGKKQGRYEKLFMVKS